MVIPIMSSVSGSSPSLGGSSSSFAAGAGAHATPAGATVITHPNRDKPVAQATRATVVLLLLVSAALVLIVTAGGWKVLEGAWPIQVAYILIYLTLAFFAARWNRGVLPVGCDVKWRGAADAVVPALAGVNGERLLVKLGFARIDTPRSVERGLGV